MLTLIGTALGGLFRMAPEVLKWLDKREDRKHEQAMFDKQLEADKLKYAAAQQIEQTRADGAIAATEIQALVAATQAQAAPTGIKWVDGLNSLVRPILTFWWAVVLYSVALCAEFYVLVWVLKVDKAAAVLELWGQDEKAIVAAIISFWFVDRSLRVRKAL